MRRRNSIAKRTDCAMNDAKPENTRNSPTDDELRFLVSALNERVPREGSWVQLTQYGGGPDEGRITGNRDGYRRLGVEFLKATVDDAPKRTFHVDLAYLITPDSTINFDWFELSDTPSSISSKRNWLERLLLVGCLMVFAMAAIIFVIGLGTVIQWAVE